MLVSWNAKRWNIYTFHFGGRCMEWGSFAMRMEVDCWFVCVWMLWVSPAKEIRLVGNGNNNIHAICSAVCNLWEICIEIIILCWFILNSKYEMQSWIEENISGRDNESLHQKDVLEMEICSSSGHCVVNDCRSRSQYRNTIFHLSLYANIFLSLFHLFGLASVFFSSIHNNGWLTAIIYYFSQFARFRVATAKPSCTEFIPDATHLFDQIIKFKKKKLLIQTWILCKRQMRRLQQLTSERYCCRWRIAKCRTYDGIESYTHSVDSRAHEHESACTRTWSEIHAINSNADAGVWQIDGLRNGFEIHLILFSYAIQLTALKLLKCLQEREANEICSFQRNDSRSFCR